MDQIPLLDMSYNAESLKLVFDYTKAMLCYSNMVPSTVDGQPDELETLTIFGVRIAADDPDLVMMHCGMNNLQLSRTSWFQKQCRISGTLCSQHRRKRLL